MTRAKIFGYFFTTTFILFILVGAFAPSGEQLTTSDKQTEKSNIEEIKKEENTTTDKTGTYDKYTFTVTDMEEGKTKIARFDPLLPRDDGVLLGAISKVTSVEFGGDIIGNTKPTLEFRDGKNLLLFTTPSGKYYYLIFKEDTGEIWSFSFWKE